MKNLSHDVIYDQNSEKELIKMWADIKGNNMSELNRNLLKAIAKNTDEKSEEEPKEDVIYSKQMWDSEKGTWVPFDLWGAHFIVNNRNEQVQLRIYRPLDIQPEYGPILKGWQSIDSSYLNEQLREKTNPYQSYNQIKSFSGRQAFYEMIKQDQQEYRDEGRIQELSSNYDENVGY